jgi:TPP-dependent pyruvate/acetoin dehydrogenase alpha subunit
MLMESLNLASVWRLPVLFVCKDSGWAITTPASDAVGGNLLQRAKAFGLQAMEVNGTEVQAVHAAAGSALKHIRQGHGPVFLWAHCSHPEGHFLGDPFLDMLRRPGYFARNRLIPALRGFFHVKGGSVAERVNAMKLILGHAFEAQRQTESGKDPLVLTRKVLNRQNSSRLRDLESALQLEIQSIISIAVTEVRAS